MALYDPGMGSGYRQPAPAPGMGGPMVQMPPSNVAPGVDAYRAAHPNDLTQGERAVGNVAGDINGGPQSALNSLKNGATTAWNWIQPKPIDPLAPVKTYPGFFNPDVNRGLADQQQTNISDLARAAAGQTPSPAEIQLQQQSGINAARQFGLASALQGRNPGAALRSAQLGSQATQADTNIQAAMLRAKEQQDARNALMEALARARQQEQGLYTTDTDYRKGMLDIGAKNAAAENTFKGGLVNGLGGLVTSIL